MKDMCEAAYRIRDMVAAGSGTYVRRWIKSDGTDKERIVRKLVENSQIVCWKNEILKMASQASFTSSLLTVSRNVFQCQIHYWENPRPLDELTREHLRKMGDSSPSSNTMCIGSMFLFTDTPKGEVVAYCGNILCKNWQSWEKVRETDISVVLAEQSIPNESDALAVNIYDYLAMNAFLKSPYGTTEPRNVKKLIGKGRRYARPPSKNEHIQVVVMRKAAKPIPQPEDVGGEMPYRLMVDTNLRSDEEAEHNVGRKLTCRVHVTGHYRNQWYPSEKTHKRIWIGEYDKGPLEARESTRVKILKAVR